MTSRTKRLLLATTTLLALVAFFWMRSLASWRPAKVGAIPQNSSAYFLTSDAKAVMTEWDLLNLHTGHRVSWLNAPFTVFSSHTPNWAFRYRFINRLEVRDSATGHLKHVFRWLQTDSEPSLVIGSDSNIVGIVAKDTFFYQWNITTGQLLHQRQLDSHIPTRELAWYAFTPDSKKLIGCYRAHGAIWDASSGKCLCSWSSRSYGFPTFFSDDARVVAYTYTSSTEIQPPLVFVDTTTGKVKWQTKENPTLYYRTGDEMVLPDATGCSILDVNTGLPKRYLAGPHKGDQILRATPDYIYTLNDKGEILRWRAR